MSGRPCSRYTVTVEQWPVPIVGGADNFIQVHYHTQVSGSHASASYQLLLENSKHSIGDLHCSDARGFFGVGISVERWLDDKWAPAGAGPYCTVPIRSLVTVDLQYTPQVSEHPRVNVLKSDKRSIPIILSRYIRRLLRLLSLYLLLGYSEFYVMFSLEAMLTCLSALTGSEPNYVLLDFAYYSSSPVSHLRLHGVS
jgi:hypothetical protein